MGEVPREENDPCDPGTDQPLVQFSPYELATLVRSLDSRVVNIRYECCDGRRTLVYTFEVAGKLQRFRLTLQLDEPVESICDLYPEAAVHEHELTQRCGVEFRLRSRT